MAALRKDPAVQVAEPSYRARALTLPNDSQFSGLPRLTATTADGTYALVGLVAGRYMVAVSHPEYTFDPADLNVAPGAGHGAPGF